MDEPKVERRVRMPPNGSSDEYGEFTTRRRSDHYVYRWCKEKHEKVDKRLDTVESRLWGIWVLLFGNLCGVTATIVLLITGSG